MEPGAIGTTSDLCLASRVNSASLNEVAGELTAKGQRMPLSAVQGTAGSAQPSR
jgi:hypothetical protein